MSLVHSVGQGCVGRIGIHGYAKDLPLGYIIVCDIGVIGGISGVTGEVGDHGHGFDADNTLEGEIGLIAADVSTNRSWHGKTYARGPAKSSVEIWLAGMRASSIRYWVHWFNIL